MNVNIRLAGFEFSNPDAYTIPCVRRTVGPFTEAEAEEWLRCRGFAHTCPRDWYKGTPSVFKRLADGNPVEAKVAAVSAEVEIVDPPADVEIIDM